MERISRFRAAILLSLFALVLVLYAFKLFRRTYVIIGEPIPFESLGYDPDASGEYARITNIAFDKICTLGEEFEAERRAKKEAKEGKKK